MIKPLLILAIKIIILKPKLNPRFFFAVFAEARFDTYGSMIRHVKSDLIDGTAGEDWNKNNKENGTNEVKGELVVETVYGYIRGTYIKNDLKAWLGVPYAEEPTGMYIIDIFNTKSFVLVPRLISPHVILK